MATPIAARIRNYKKYLNIYHGIKPNYYDLVGDKKDDFKVIQTNLVVHFYRVRMELSISIE